MSENWQKFKEIFQDALDLPSKARLDFVRSKTADDEELFEKVKNLLASYDDAEDFIESPQVSVSKFVTDAPKVSVIGQKIGNYKIESEIGRGGMGAVYLATRADKEFEKKVAVKLIKRGLDTDEIIKRFRNERQILAGLDHPNITRLIDGGATDDGLPFLVMDYVEGEPLTKYCEKQDLSIDEHLKLFLKICSAVRYAHQNLIIHRDLKPSNVLVTEDGVPKLLDFGIAKLIAEEANDETQNNTMTRVMTPEYASPEQIQGKPITTSTDVYSLGVMLYELLTGERPYHIKSKNAEEISKIITDSEPLKPSSVLSSKNRIQSTTSDSENPKPKIQNPKSLKGDLDNIVLMAMRKEPERRYSSVEQFAEDIQRYLSGLPVIAQEDTFTYRAEKFIKRNKGGVAAGIGIAVSLIAGLAATARQAKIAKRQRDKARLEARKAEKVNQFLQKMLASADPREQGKDVKVIEVLGEAAKEIESDFSDQPEIASDLHTTIGTTYLNLGLFDSAKNHLKKALDLRFEHFPRRTFEVAVSLHNFGNLLRDKGEVNVAEPFYIEASETFRFLGKDAEVADVLDNFGYLLLLNGKILQAIPTYTEALAIRRALFGENHPDVAKTLGNLAQAYNVLGERQKSEAHHRQALAILQKFYSEGHPDVLSEMTHLASSLMWRDKTESEQLFRKVLALKRKYLGENHPEVAWTLYEMAFLNTERGEYVAAETLAREILAMRGKGLIEGHSTINGALVTLGRSLLAQSKPEEAKLALEECLFLRKKSLSENHWLLATTNSFYGECLMLLGKHEEGKRLLFESYNVLLEKFGTEHDRTRGALERIKKFFD